MITENQLREALKRCTDEDTKPLADEVPTPRPPARGEGTRNEYLAMVRSWTTGVWFRSVGRLWSDMEFEDQAVRDGWLAQHLEYLRWKHRNEDICPMCLGEPAEAEGPLIYDRPEMSQYICDSGHLWHWCPEHGVKVAGEYDYDKQPNCTCGATDKETTS